MPEVSVQDVTLRPENGSEEDNAFMRTLFCSLEQVQSLMLIGKQAEPLIDMQLRAREQQYRTVYPNGEFQLILLDGEPIGRVATDQTTDVWRLIDIALMPAWRGYRLGGQLVERFLRSADAAGCDVAASVLASNVKALKLWLRIGFQVVEERPDYWSLIYTSAQSDE